MGSKAAGAAEHKDDKVKEFDRWSDDETPEVEQKRDFDAWSEASEEAEAEAKHEAEAPFFTDAEPDFSLVDLGVSSKKSAPHPSEALAEVPVKRLAPKPPKAPPPSYLLKAAELPLPPPPKTPPMRHIRPVRPVVRPMRTVVQPVPVVLVPVSLSTAWSCFFSLQHGTERMKLMATVVLGDPSPAQALIQEANANLKLSHRSHFDDVKKAALKVVLQLVPMSAQQDQQARDSLEKYLLSKDRAGVVRVGNRDLYLIPPTKAEDCGLQVRPPGKCLVAAVAEKHRPKKTKVQNVQSQQVQPAPEAKKAAEVLVADDTEDSEEAKDDKNEERNDNKKDDEGGAAAEVQEQEEEKKETQISDSKDEIKVEGEQESKQTEAASEEVEEDSPEQREEKKVKQVWPPSQAKPRFTRQDVEQAAFELARSRDSRPVRAPPAPAPFPHPEPWWNPYACPPGELMQPEPERRRKRHRSSKEHGKRARRRSKSKDSSSSAQPSSGRAEATATQQFKNPYVDPAPTETTEAKDESSTDEKWKGLLARVEALAQFCRDGNDAEPTPPRP